MNSTLYNAGRIVSTWGALAGFILCVALVDGWATPIVLGCAWFTICLIAGKSLRATATDTRQVRYLQIRKAQQDQD